MRSGFDSRKGLQRKETMSIFRFFKKSKPSDEMDRDHDGRIFEVVPVSSINFNEEDSFVPLENVFDRYIAGERIFSDPHLHRRWETFKPSRKVNSKIRRRAI